MASTWGLTTLNIMEYNRESPESFLNEVDLIPSLDDAGDVPQTALIGWGTRRRKINMKVHCTDAEWWSFGQDKQNYTKRALSIDSSPETLSWTYALIFDATLEKRKGTDKCFVNLIFIEHTSS